MAAGGISVFENGVSDFAWEISDFEESSDLRAVWCVSVDGVDGLEVFLSLRDTEWGGGRSRELRRFDVEEMESESGFWELLKV